jgi:hypothetical protein
MDACTLTRPERSLRIELGPSEPKCLMAAQVGAIGIDRPDAARIELKADVFVGNLRPLPQSQQCGASLKGHRLSGCRDNADDVLVHRQARIDIADGEDRPLSVPAVSEIGIAAKSQFLDQYRRLGMGFFSRCPSQW